MKTLVLACFLFLGFSISAQPDFTGNWSGEGVKNGQPMGFHLAFNDTGQFEIIYEANPSGLEIKGNWKFGRDKLSFKNSDGILVLKQVAQRPKGHRSLLVEFRKGNKSFFFIGASGNFNLLAWEKREKSISLNFEE